ncbi:MAG TPA: oxygenase MpaB family protein [Nocardioides sp.]|nr:oxygenase MpaB family protein [Nocardioides sp.]
MRYPVSSAAREIPSRHPAHPLPVPAAVGLLARTLRVQPADEAEFRRYGEALTEGDPLMDEVVAWMMATGRTEGRRLFEQALAHGIATVPDAPGPLRALFEEVERTPDWVDRDLLDRGARVLRSGGADGLYVARDVALHGGYLFSGFNQTLLRTGALEKGSNQRFAETTRWAIDTISPGGLVPGGRGFQSTIRVRMIHSFVRRHVSAMPDWDSTAWGLPINQTDMAATIHGTFIAPVTASMVLGMFNSPRNLEAVAHLTRYVGWLIGVEEEFLPHSFRSAVRNQCAVLSALARPDETSRMLAIPMAEDPMLWSFDRFPTVRRRIARSQHLSVTRAALGPGAMAKLGLSTRVLPWYPVLRYPVNVLRSALLLLPGGLDRGARRGDREQQRFLERTGASQQIGGSVRGLHP